MAQHYFEIISIVFLLVFAATMFYQGTCIMRNQRGYSLRDYMKHDSTNMRKRIEDLLKDK
jgi:ABC-type nickel/cobalt efflux system permease component RcnA